MEKSIKSITESAERKSDLRRLMLTLGCAAIMLITCLILNVVTFRKMQVSSSEEAIIRSRLAQMNYLTTVLQDVELGKRGYILSGDEKHLKVYNRARNSYTSEWMTLANLVRKDGDNLEQLEPLRITAERLLEVATQAVIIREGQGEAAASRFFSETENRDLMQEVRQLVDLRVAYLEKLKVERSKVAEQDFKAGLIASVAMGALSLGMGGLALILLRRVLGEMKRAQRYALSMLRAQESRRQKDIFLATMSHEIRTPLNAIIGFGQLAQNEKMGVSAKRYVTSILDGGNALLLLINDILDISKLEAGRMKLDPEPTNIHELMEFMRKIFQETCSEKGVAIHFEIQPDIPQSLTLDAARLRQVLMNLIGNAVKFTDEGKVEILANGTKNPSDTSKWDISIKVRDSGKGISDEEIPKVFEAFYQAHGSQGTGLGLSIVKRFISLMDGEVTVTSKLGEGSEFSIHLPARSVSSRISNETHTLVDDVDFNSLHPSCLLAVDDNEMNLELIREIFKGSHHTVSTATNGQEAIDVIAADKPDLVLMDLRMPVMDGVEAAAEIKRREEMASLPVIAVTAGSLPGESDRLKESNHFDFSLRKPFSSRELYDALAVFLEKKSSVKPPEADTTVDAELYSRLSTLLDSEWSQVKGRMIDSEVEQFAAKVIALCNGGKPEIVILWAEKLAREAKECAFAEMENTLSGFPALLEKLDIEASKLNP